MCLVAILEETQMIKELSSIAIELMEVVIIFD